MSSIGVVERYRAHLEGSALAPLSRRSYLRRVEAFVTWLDGHREHGDALHNASARDWAVRDYRISMKDAKRAPATINAALAAVDDLYRFLGLGPAQGQTGTHKPGRTSSSVGGPAASPAPGPRGPGRPRDRATVALMAFAGLRVAEVAALDVEDISLTARTGTVRVRRGKGDSERTVPLPVEARSALAGWIHIRPLGNGTALFPGAVGSRLSVRALHRSVATAGMQAGLALSPHALRHTYVTRLVRRGVDLPTVAELAGHRRLETTRRYSRPSADDRQAAVDKAPRARLLTRASMPDPRRSHRGPLSAPAPGHPRATPPAHAPFTGRASWGGRAQPLRWVDGCAQAVEKRGERR